MEPQWLEGKKSKPITATKIERKKKIETKIRTTISFEMKKRRKKGKRGAAYAAIAMRTSLLDAKMGIVGSFL
jgi:hypothetical protein